MPKNSAFTGYLNAELGLLRTDEDDIEELNEMYGPLCWQGCENDHGGFKELMWYGIMKEFNCNATCPSAPRERRPSLTNNMVKRGKNGRRNWIIGPRWKSDEAYIYNDEKVWDSWDHYPICAMIQEY